MSDLVVLRYTFTGATRLLKEHIEIDPDLSRTIVSLVDNHLQSDGDSSTIMMAPSADPDRRIDQHI